MLRNKSINCLGLPAVRTPQDSVDTRRPSNRSDSAYPTQKTALFGDLMHNPRLQGLTPLPTFDVGPPRPNGVIKLIPTLTAQSSNRLQKPKGTRPTVNRMTNGKNYRTHKNMHRTTKEGRTVGR